MDCVFVRYHEIALKRGNRSYFLEHLKKNIAAALKGTGLKEIRSISARLLLVFNRNIDIEEVGSRLGAVFGIANFSPVERVENDIEPLGARILEALETYSFDSFRIETKRADKGFPLSSYQVNCVLGDLVRRKFGARVDLGHPELTVSVEILPQYAVVGFERCPGPGGLPVGVSGRVLALISGGIDSPVAAYRIMQRGCRVIYVHFHSSPFLDKSSQEKVRELVELLTRHQFASRLYLVPFGEIQRQIVASVLRPLRVVLYRRMMLRIASSIARKEHARALVTGESLAQVASQTLANLSVIEDAASLPVLRPLIGMDKQEIVDQAVRIGTFATSARPDQDCCQLFIPRHPAIHATLRGVREAEENLEIEEMTRAGVEQAEIERFHFPPALEQAPEPAGMR